MLVQQIEAPRTTASEPSCGASRPTVGARSAMTDHGVIDRFDGGTPTIREGATTVERDVVLAAQQVLALGEAGHLGLTLATDSGGLGGGPRPRRRLAPDQRIVRRIARQGAANAGFTVTHTSAIPDVCVTAGGVWWHPVGATDRTMDVSDHWALLRTTIETSAARIRISNDVLASTFRCA